MTVEVRVGVSVMVDVKVNGQVGVTTVGEDFAGNNQLCGRELSSHNPPAAIKTIKKTKIIVTRNEERGRLFFELASRRVRDFSGIELAGTSG